MADTTLDKVVRFIESDIKEIVQQRERLEQSIADTTERIKNAKLQEREARKLLKNMRSRQNRDNTTPRANVLKIAEYDEVLAVLRDQDTFRRDEFAALLGIENTKTATNKLRYLVTQNKVRVIRAGTPGFTDSAIYEVV